MHCSITSSVFRLLLLFGFIVSITGCSIFFAKPPCVPLGQPATALDTVLSVLSLRRDDVGINCTLRQNDPFFLDKVGILLNKPLLLNSFAQYCEATLNNTPRSVSSLIVLAADAMELPIAAVALKEEAGACAECQGLPAPLKDSIENIYVSLFWARRSYARAFKGLTAAEQVFIKKRFEELLWSFSSGTTRTRKEDQNVHERALYLAAQVHRRNLLEGALIVAAAIDKALRLLNDQHLLLIRSQVNVQQITMHSPIGEIIIGGFGNNRYDGAIPALLIDLGGDDQYEFTRYNPFSVIVDLSGNDMYLPTEGSAYGAGILGVGFLVDREGNDHYAGQNSTLGTGFFGVGVLIDEQGDDVYVSHTLAEGAGAFGAGILCDYAGNDFYQSAMYSQGFGFTGGCGFLIDYAGNDKVLSCGGIADFREKSNAYQTCSQGFGQGFRGFAAGGIGMLYNGSGDDVYEGSYFCQGSSYWLSIGMLIDNAGSDTYQARRYAQGAGVHSSIGALLDRAGNDTYTSWAVSQACGHDHSMGILWDSQGDDRYVAEWLSQGSGNDSGRGLLIDEQGNDIYTAGTHGTQGCGIFNERRDEPSIGILIDGSGNDTFNGTGKNNTVWTCGRIGGGADVAGEMPAVSVPCDVWLGGEEIRHGTRGMGNNAECVKKESLGYNEQIKGNGQKNWIVVPELEGALISEDSWDKASERLAEKIPSIIPALFQYMDIKDVSVARTLEETFKKIARKDVKRIHILMLQEGLESSKKSFLLYVLSDIAHPESKDFFVSLLKDRDTKIQALALRGLYKLKASPPIKDAQRLIKSADVEVRKYLAFSLRYCEDGTAISLRTKLQKDVDLNVRYAASVLK
jgi:hypothetical protein